MKQLSIPLNRTLGIAAAACALGGLACSSSEAPAPAAGGAGGQTTQCQNPNALEIFFSPMHSAFDGVHTFQVPAIVNGVSNATVTWSASPADAVVLDPRPELLMMTTRKPGVVTIQAQNGADCGSAQLTITEATPAEWEAGNTRYNNAQALPPIPNPPLPPADGSNLFEAGGARPACTNCHGETATAGIFQGVTHTPQQTAGFNDEQMVKVITSGEIPEGGYYNEAVGLPQRFWSFFHRWTVSPEESRGLVVYLRSLTPKPAGGNIDFRGVGGGTGGSSGMGGAGGTSGAAGASGSTGTGGAGGTAGTGGSGGATDAGSPDSGGAAGTG